MMSLLLERQWTLVSRLSLFRRGAVPAAISRRSGQNKARSGQNEASHDRVWGRTD